MGTGEPESAIGVESPWIAARVATMAHARGALGRANGGAPMAAGPGGRARIARGRRASS